MRVHSGDKKNVTQSICRRLKLNTENILTGTDLQNINDDEILQKVESTEVFAELTPEQKSFVVKILQQNGHTVGFLGDGLNDINAITQCDAGISVENSVAALKDCSNVILGKKDLNVLEEGIVQGRKAFMNMTKYIKITASSNFGNIFSIVLASVLLPFFPMSALQLFQIVTVLGILIFIALIYTPLGNFVGFCSLPPQYYIFLFAVAASYLGLMTVAKKIYIKKNKTLY